MNLHDRNQPRVQRGIVLFTVLIALVVLSLASVALVRSIDTGTTIAGNLAFRQAATQAGDAGTEAALAWIQGQIAANGGIVLHTSKASGYYATSRSGCDLTGGLTASTADNVRWEAGTLTIPTATWSRPPSRTISCRRVTPRPMSSTGCAMPTGRRMAPVQGASPWRVKCTRVPARRLRTGVR